MPSSFTSICVPLNEQLLTIAKEHAPQVKRTQNGTLLALLDQYNTSSVEAVPIDRKDGKIKQVQVMAQKRATVDEVSENVPDCLEGPYNVSDNFEQIYEIDDSVYTDFEVDDYMVRELCENQSSWMAKEVSNRMDSLFTKMNQKVVNDIITKFGNYANGVNSGVSPLALDMVQPLAAGGMNGANYQGEVIMRNTLSDARVAGTPMAIGVGELRDYVGIRNYSSSNALGIDLSRGGSFAYFEDPYVGTALANVNQFIALEAGAYQFVPVNFYVGDMHVKNEETYVQDTIVDPITGYVYDFEMIYDLRCKKWQCRISSRFAKIELYKDGYKATDPLFGVNGIFKFNSAT
jgi:hypothetical protein